MFAHAFRFEPFRASASSASTFQARMRSAFAPRKPRHRVLRVVFGLIGVALLALVVMFGLFVGAAMIAVGLAYRLWKQRGKPLAATGRNHADAHRDALDAEYRVVAPLSLPR